MENPSISWRTIWQIRHSQAVNRQLNENRYGPDRKSSVPSSTDFWFWKALFTFLSKKFQSLESFYRLTSKIY